MGTQANPASLIDIGPVSESPFGDVTECCAKARADLRAAGMSPCEPTLLTKQLFKPISPEIDKITPALYHFTIVPYPLFLNRGAFHHAMGSLCFCLHRRDDSD